MKKFAYITVIVILLSLSAAALGQGNQYVSIEVYPNDPIFIAMGTDIGHHFKADLWTNSGCELGVTVGPKIGPFNIGGGLSYGVPKDKTDLLYLNADIAFGADLAGFHWQSYNLFQRGQNGSSDFILLRQSISYQDYPLGLIGHNIQKGAEPFKLFWGPYYDFKRILLIRHNKFAITVDLKDNSNIWTAWIVEF